jgi:2-oxoglutarate dehydrogenase E2 component (dihydrolipoamide succinyltransferase)
MKIIEMIMPQMGESILECTVLALLKQVGELVEADESVLEVATDKVDTEVPSLYSGTILEWLVKVDDVVAIGSPIAKIEVPDEVIADSEEDVLDAESAAAHLEKEMSSVWDETHASRASLRESEVKMENNSGFFSPLVLTIAEKEGITKAELQSIPGSGMDSRVTKEDILAYLKTRGQQTVRKEPLSFAVSGEVEIIEMDRMRKMIAQRMIESRQTSAHVTSFIETDMTSLVKWREKIKHSFQAKTGEGITFTPLLVAATAAAIRRFPMMNVSVDGQRILVKKEINIGIAVALPNGNLIVPVIHRADQYDLAGLTQKVNDLVRRARANHLTADDLANGTFSISNIGTFGNLMGTPIIMQPQVGILAFGAIQKKPAVVETPSGDFVGIRHKMFISHSYDHRVVDGSLGGMFLKQVSDNLEQFDTNIAF